jgi:hypothetical protein
MPLLAQPGTRWSYSIGVDVQGYLVEKFSGQRSPISCARACSSRSG